MITLDAGELTLVNSGARGLAVLVELNFLSGVQRFTTWPHDLPISGNTWIGLKGLGTISPLRDSEDTKTDKLVLSLSIVNTAMLAAAVGSASEYRGRVVTISLQLIDETLKPAGTAKPLWAGEMVGIKITRNSSKMADGNNGGTIDLECARFGTTRSRNAEGLRLTHAQQQARFPGDLGLEYVPKLIEQPQVWLSKKFQTI